MPSTFLFAFLLLEVELALLLCLALFFANLLTLCFGGLKLQL